MSSFTRAVLNASRNIIKARYPSAQKFRVGPVAPNVVFAVCYSSSKYPTVSGRLPNESPLRQRARTKIEQIRADAKKAETLRHAPRGVVPLLHKQPEQKLMENEIEKEAEAPTKTDEENRKNEAEEEPKIEEGEDSTSSPEPKILSTFTQAEATGKIEEDERDKSREQSWQTMKFTFLVFGVTFTLIALVLIYELGRPKRNEAGEVITDEFSSLPLIQQYFYRLVRELDYYRKFISEPSREKLLPDVLQYPYHQPPYTVVLELKDVLVHPDWTYSTGWRFKKRPGIDQFLETLNGIYEIVIYTAELGMTVFPILEALDPNNLITYKLVRDATNFVNGHYVKDLDKLNRDLNKVVLVDWDSNAVHSNGDNILQIPRWNGNDDDTTLLDLANFLRVIATSEIQDVRDVLRYYKEFPDPVAAFKEKQRELERTMYAKQVR